MADPVTKTEVRPPTALEKLKGFLVQPSTMNRLAELYLGQNPKERAELARRAAMVAYQAAVRQPKLATAEASSFLKALLEAAELQLDPCGLLGQGYLIPYEMQGKVIVQFQPGYRGLITLALRFAKNVSKVDAFAVHQRDQFLPDLGADKITHIPYMGMDDPGPIIAAWARVTYSDGSPAKWLPMSWREIEAVRNTSQAFRYAEKKGDKDSPWHTDAEEMSKKTVVKRILKTLDLAPELGRALEYDNRRETGDTTADIVDVGTGEIVEEGTTQASDIKRRVGRTAAHETAVEAQGMEKPMPPPEKQTVKEASKDQPLFDEKKQNRMDAPTEKTVKAINDLVKSLNMNQDDWAGHCQHVIGHSSYETETEARKVIAALQELAKA